MIGKLIANKYKILEMLGRGGFGTTYLALHTLLNKKFVIKISESADKAFTNRFFKEAQVLSRIDHPRIVALRDSGQLDDGRAYLVLDWIDGITLAEVLIDGPVSYQIAVIVARALAKGLSVIHQMKILHRDIKPSNIIIPTLNGKLSFEDATLTDLGVFGELIKKSYQKAAMTIAGQLFGTPKYMSPEQIQAIEQTASSDIYGLGIVLYEMIYGVLPFWDEQDTNYTFIQKVVTEKALLPEYPKIPTALGSFIIRCLNKDPRKRPQSGINAYEEINYLLQSLQHKDFLDSNLDQPVSKKLSPKPLFKIAMILTIIVSLIIITFTIWRFKNYLFQTEGFIIGFLLIVGGILLSFLFRKLFSERKTEIEKDASKLLFGTQSRDKLSTSLAIEVDQLVLRCKSLDQKILGITMAQMISEYQVARSSSDRQAALMNVVQLLEKLRIRISPWYVRKEKLITFVVSSVGIISGIVSIILSILKVVKGN